MSDEWYVARRGQDGNKRYGPVPLHQLRDLIDSGRVQGGDLVWQDGMAGWQRADQCETLFPPRRGFDYDRGGYDPRYDDDDRPYRRRRYYPPPPSTSPWVIPLVVIGSLVGLMVLGCGGAGVVALLNGGPTYSSSYYSNPALAPADDADEDPPPGADPNVFAPNPNPPDFGNINPPVFPPPPGQPVFPPPPDPQQPLPPP